MLFEKMQSTFQMGERVHEIVDKLWLFKCVKNKRTVWILMISTYDCMIKFAYSSVLVESDLFSLAMTSFASKVEVLL